MTETKWSQGGEIVDCFLPLLRDRDEEVAHDVKEKPNLLKGESTSSKTEKDDSVASSSKKRSRGIQEDSPSISSEDSRNFSPRQRKAQAELWKERFLELVEYRAKHGHCLVPNHWTENAPLALWVKRQRYQYKLKKEGQHSNLTDKREMALQELGFVWDSHGAIWEERLNELKQYRESRGHCNVPANFAENRQLAIWVKCQRRQYRLFCEGQRSNMTEERIQKLSSLGFVWNPRSRSSSTSCFGASESASQTSLSTNHSFP